MFDQLIEGPRSDPNYDFRVIDLERSSKEVEPYLNKLIPRIAVAIAIHSDTLIHSKPTRGWSELLATFADVQTQVSRTLESALFYRSSPSAISSGSSSPFIGELNNTIADATRLRNEALAFHDEIYSLVSEFETEPSEANGIASEYIGWPAFCNSFSDPRETDPSESKGTVPNYIDWSVFCSPCTASSLLEEYAEYYLGIVDSLNGAVASLLRYQVLLIALFVLFTLGNLSSCVAKGVEGCIPYLTWPRPPTLARKTEYAFS